MFDEKTASAETLSPKEQVDTRTELQDLQAETLTELAKASSSEERVRTFGRIMDDYGADAIISLFPELGDAASSVGSALYLLCEAKNADLDKKSYLKIIGMQTADFFVGAVPIVGDVADYFFKASKWSVSEFEDRTADLEARARELEIPEEQIALLREDAKKLPQIIENVLADLPGPTGGERMAA